MNNHKVSQQSNKDNYNHKVTWHGHKDQKDRFFQKAYYLAY